MRVALVQTPAWGALPPLGSAALKAFVQEHGHEARCIDLNIEFYNAHQRSKVDLESTGVSYGGPDPWGADSYGQWALDYSSVRADPDDIRFEPGSMYNDSPLPLEEWAQEVLRRSRCRRVHDVPHELHLQPAAGEGDPPAGTAGGAGLRRTERRPGS